MLTFRKRYGVGGGSETIQLRAADENGGFADLTGEFDGSEPLTALVWPGDDRAQTATLPAEWDDGPAGRVRVDFPLETMTALAVGWYDGMLKLADGSLDLAAFRVEVLPGPGTGGAPKAYHTYQDLTDELPWVGKLADYLQDQSGFAEVAAESRRWIDGCVLAAVPSRGSVPNPRQFDLGGSGLAHSVEIAELLDADGLDVTSPAGRRIVRAAVHRSLATILGRSVGMPGRTDLIDLADRHARKADNALMSAVAEIRAEPDGPVLYAIPLGVTNTRRM